MTCTQENRTQDIWFQEIRENQGNYEQEITSGDEADLYKCYTSCTKNPGHVQFKNVNTFRSEHLPERYRSDQKLIDLVRFQADMTCLIKVSYVSPDRPETLPFYKYRGRRGFSRSGTGWVGSVKVFTEKDTGNNSKNRLCQCQTCQLSGEPRSDWAKVRIITASHVVFDKSEAEDCKCYFFYDNSQEKLSDCPVITATQVNSVWGNIDDDFSEIVYYIHDVELARKLQDLCARYSSLCDDLNQKYGPIRHVVTARAAEEKDDDKNKDDNTQVLILADKDANISAKGHGVQDHLSQTENMEDVDNVSRSHDDYFDDHRYKPEHDLVIITSHPHGCSKKVTVGHVTHIRGQDKIKYEYSTATCPGSSGAPLFVLGSWAVGSYHPHSGHVRGQGPEQINHSSTLMLST